MSPPAKPAPSAATPPRPTPVRWLERAELATGAFFLVLVFVLMLVQAVQRHLPVEGWVWTGELARLGLVWLAFSLVGYLVGRDEHLTLKLVDMVAGPRLLRAVWVFANLTVAAIGVLLIVEAVSLVFGDSPLSTPALEIPVGWTYLVPLAGLALAVLRAVVNAFLPAPPKEEDPR
ncbi:TRAP transporter small permease [Nocardiopsis salina]|uniref:TRAP transporter small permease n=1 Tax=Nocardiopsis salina TaxID=245836 RepID=UPI000685145B|nr:TRAP transporter small permease subunit [Nocardiopsis salina]